MTKPWFALAGLNTGGTNPEPDSLCIIWALAGVKVPMRLIFFGGRDDPIVGAVQKL